MIRPQLLARVLGIGLATGHLDAQQVIQVEGGGNSFTGAYGGTVRLWGPRYEGWIGLGYADDVRMAGFLKTSVGRDTLRLGFDAFPLALPTDVLAGSPYLVTQGAAWQHITNRIRLLAFAGVAGTGVSAPFVNSSQSEKPLGALQLTAQATPAVSLQTLAVGARRQSILQSVSWQMPRHLGLASAAAGVGANQPFGAVVWRRDTPRLEISTGYTYVDPRFRRADAPLPVASELRAEQAHITVRPWPTTFVTVGRRNFFVAQDTGATVNYALNQASAGTSLAAWRLNAGVFESRSGLGDVFSGFAGVGRDLGRRGSADLMLTESRQSRGGRSRVATLGVRQDVRYDLSLSQYLTYTGGATSLGLGGSYRRGLTNISATYQTLYVPTRRPDPFVRALMVEIRLQVGSYATSIVTNVDPTGHVSYMASGSTYLYLGQPALGLGGQPITIRIQRLIIRGVVVDDGGAPIEGAAVDIGGTVVVTNSRGEFFIRSGRRTPQPVRVVFDEFLASGDFEVVDAPPSVVATDEDRAIPVRIVLRRLLGIRPPQRR